MESELVGKRNSSFKTHLPYSFSNSDLLYGNANMIIKNNVNPINDKNIGRVSLG